MKQKAMQSELENGKKEVDEIKKQSIKGLTQ